MRFHAIVIAALITPLFLTGCGGDPGGHNPYDGVWTMSYDTGIANTSTTSCTIPTASITLTNGAGSTTQIETCVYTQSIIIGGASGVITTTTSTTDLLTAININGQGMQAIVNGNTYSGKCISQNGCSAQEGTGVGSITMTR